MYKLKYLFSSAALVFLASCATTQPAPAATVEKVEEKLNPVQLRKKNVYECVIELLDKEVSAVTAEKVCTNIFSKHRIN